MKNIKIIDATSEYNHQTIKNRANGASEYQLYNLIYNISTFSNIICYNHYKIEEKIDNVIYKSYKNIVNDNINLDDIIIIQRFIPNSLNEIILEKLKNNKIFIWMHDLIQKNIFLWDIQNKSYYDDDSIYKNEILEIYNKYKNINFIFVSYFLKDMFVNFFKNYNINIEENRLHVIYNILYEDEFKQNEDTNISINYNNIVYASAWQKGIEHIINVYDYIYNKNKNINLVLMSPGYDWNNWETYRENLKKKYGDNVIIHGPINKQQYSKIIKESLCVLSPRFGETFGCVFAESYYLNTPVIADIYSGAVKEIIDNNCIVNYDNKEECYNKIIDIQNNREKINVNLKDKFKFKYNLELWNNLLNII